MARTPERRRARLPWRHVLAAWLQYPLPHHRLSGLAWRLARARSPWLKNLLIRLFARRYRVDLTEAEQTDPRAYPDFNSFFTRALAPGARPVPADPDCVISPVDGRFVEQGALQQRTVIRAKGAGFDLERLLGGSGSLSRRLMGGSFATLYLSPRDYHRIHMPWAGELREMVYLPGRLFSVNPATTRLVPDLFARNERVVLHFETGIGPLGLVLVGAIFVGSVAVPWAGTVVPPRSGRPQRWEYAPGAQVFARGEEIGRFNLGSTVIVLFGPGAVRWEATLEVGQVVRMGETLARPGA